MTIRYTSSFLRAYRKLSPDQRKNADDAIRVFEKDPFSPQLRNHKLQGKERGKRSISASYDLRIVYLEEGGHVTVLMLKIGTHDAVY